MTWFKVDDGFAFHEKAVAAGNAAIGLWVRAGSWCSQQLNDGLVPGHMVRMLGNRQQAEALVKVGLWTRDGEDYRFWQWDERNPLRRQVEDDRAAARLRMARLRSPSVRANTARTSEPVRDPRPDPTRPDPFLGEVGEDVDVEVGEIKGNVNVEELPPPEHDDPSETAAARAAIARAVRAWGLDDDEAVGA